MAEHVADGGGAYRFRCHLKLARLIESRAARGVLIGVHARRRVEGETRAYRKLAKGPRLRSPVQISERSGEPLELMLRPVVIAVHHCERSFVQLVSDDGWGAH